MKKSFLPALAAVLACVSLAACQRAGAGRRVGVMAADPRAQTSSPARADAPHTPALPSEEQTDRQPLKLPLADPKLVVNKAARRLVLYAGGRSLRTYRVALGFAPEGDKVRQGDGRTPEGTFYVCVKNDKSNFYLSLGLTYPNEEDAERGLRDGLITLAQHRSITRAAKRRARPFWNTALGGEIFIHGGGTASDWTHGCVALENEHIKELFDVVPMGTPVVIEP